jgi:hypothetical protein
LSAGNLFTNTILWPWESEIKKEIWMHNDIIGTLLSMSMMMMGMMGMMSMIVMVKIAMMRMWY